jgi:predicted transcriptional regulator
MLENDSNIAKLAIDPDNPPPLTERSELEALNTIPDDAMDYSGIPGLPDKFSKDEACRPLHKKLFEIAAEIVQAQAASTSMATPEIVSSLRLIFQTLQEIRKSEAAGTVLTAQMMREETQIAKEALKPAAPQDSIREDRIMCLECGAAMRQLTSKHLVSHGMDQKQYRQKYGFSMRTPLAAKSLTKARSKAAKKRGLPEELQKFIEARRQAKAGAKTASKLSGPGPEGVK